MIFSSIRVKLTLWYIAILALIIFAFGGVTYVVVVNEVQRETDDNLAEIAKSLAASVTMELARGEHVHPEERMIEALVDYRYRDYHCAFTAGDELVSTTMQTELPASLPNDVRPESFGDTVIGGEPFRVFLQPFTSKGKDYR